MNEQDVEELARWLFAAFQKADEGIDGTSESKGSFDGLWLERQTLYRHVAAKLLTNPPECLAMPPILIVRKESP